MSESSGGVLDFEKEGQRHVALSDDDSQTTNEEVQIMSEYKKLLHERLRAYISGEEYCEGLLKATTGKTCEDVGACRRCYHEIAKCVADEIELYYVPRPRRYTTKALDADGVEIKVGQKRWGTESGNEYDVLEIKDDEGLVKCGCHFKSGKDLYAWLEPSQLTNERPVFDAGGVRTCKGDTVWTFNGIKRTVAKVGTERCNGMIGWDGSPWVMFTNGGWEHAKDVSHNEPDSLEKLRDDILRLAADDRGASFLDEALHGYADRLTALIERGV